MPLGYNELSKIEEQVLKNIKIGLYRANTCDELENYLEQIGYSDVIAAHQTSYLKNAKVLIFGDSRTNVDELIKGAKELGLDPKLLEFRLDYKKNKHFDFRVLKNNQTYSDVMLGPNAHKSMGIGNNTSAIEMFNEHPELYPNKVDIQTESGQLKITKSSFMNALMKTQMYKDIFTY